MLGREGGLGKCGARCGGCGEVRGEVRGKYRGCGGSELGLGEVKRDVERGLRVWRSRGRCGECGEV